MQSRYIKQNDIVMISYYPFHSFQRSLLSSCSVRVIFLVLLLAYTNPLKAMKPEEPIPDISQKSTIKQYQPIELHLDADHPLTREFWKKRKFSEQFISFKQEIDKIKKKIIDRKINIHDFINKNFDVLKGILKCDECTPTSSIEDLKEIHLHDQDLISFIDRDNAKMPKGWSKANVIIFPYKVEKLSMQLTCTDERPSLIAVKKFGDIATGLKELIESLIAFDINPAPAQLKMAQIIDAVICPKDSLSIIMEAIPGQDIHSCLSNEKVSTDAVKACAAYMARFHIESHRDLNLDSIKRKYFLENAAKFYNSLKQDTLKEEDSIYKLLSLNPREQLSDDEPVKSHNVVFLLSDKDREEFVRLVEISCKVFRKNAEKIFGSFRNTAQKIPYFLTRNHGDAHAHNFFYDGSLLIPIALNSSYRISMIDFASIINTAEHIGDPAEDVGRFLAALVNWEIIEQHDDKDDKLEKARYLQTAFLDIYLKEIEDSEIIDEFDKNKFEKIFKENCNFYKLRYYRAIFNVQKDKALEKDREIKRKFLESWIEENAGLESFIKGPKPRTREKSKHRFWKPVCKDQKNNIYWLPKRSKKFIESAQKGVGNELSNRLEETT